LTKIIFQRFLNDHSFKLILISKKVINLQNLLVYKCPFLINGLISQIHSFFIGLTDLSNDQIEQYDLHNYRIENKEEPSDDHSD